MDDRKRDDQSHEQSVQTEAGEPGRTPGSAEGERREIEEALDEQAEPANENA